MKTIVSTLGCRSKRWMSTVLFCVFVLASQTPARAAHGELAPGVDYGSFNSSPKGFLTCVGAAESDYCFVVQEDNDEAGASQTEVVVQEFLHTDLLLPERTVAVTLSTDTLQIATHPRLTLTFSGEIPSIGQVDLDLITQTNSGLDATNDGCLGYAIHTEIVSPDSGIYGVLRTTGTIAGVQAYGGDPCDLFFISPTTGLWRMASGA